MKRIASVAVAFSAALFAIGCSPELSALTVPPPNATASLSQEDHTIELSRGIAFGVECRYQHGACNEATAKTDDPKIARVFKGYTDLLSYTYREGKAPQSVFVLVGVSVGKTTLHIETKDGDRDFDVSIVGP